MNTKDITAKLALLLIILLLLPCNALAQKKKKIKQKDQPFTVVIDPGHGGVDPGAIGRKAKEKDVNMSVSKLLSEMIKEEYPEVKVIFTRTTDVKIPLIKRATTANNAKADLFISIHSNASKNKKARGCETFTLGSGSSAEAKAAAMYENEVILQEDNYEQIYKGFNPRSSESYIIFELLRAQDMEKSAELANLVQKGMVKHTGLPNRGVSSAGFLVLHKTVMPKILVEVGFITNKEEEKFIASKEGQKKLAKGIFEGFSEYYKIYGKHDEAKAAGSKKAEPAKKEAAKSGVPVFKIQIFSTDRELKSNDKRFKGLKATYYKEGKWYKYTCCESENYNEVLKKKKEVSKKFKSAFIVAFIDGKKVDTQKAIKIFKKQKK